MIRFVDDKVDLLRDKNRRKKLKGQGDLETTN